MELLHTFVANMRGFRYARRITQFELAQRTDLTMSYIAMIEHGRRSPSLGALAAIGKALRVQPYRLLKPGAAPSSPAGRCRVDRRGRR